MKEGEEVSKKSISTGTSIPYGSRVQTEKDSLAIISFPEGSKLKVDPDTKVEVQEPVKEENGSSSKTLHLLKGGIMMEFVRSHPEDTILIEREFVSLAVRGTKFFMGEEGDDIYASVEKGTVALVKNDSLDYEDVKAGESIVVESGKSLTVPSRYNWSKGINWRLGNKARQSGFFSGENRRERVKEVRERISKLRARKKKKLQGRFKKRMERVKERRQNRRQKLQNMRKKRKNRLQDLKKTQNTNRKQKVQKFKDRLRRKKLLRRRRN
jgi:hypothetical protein